MADVKLVHTMALSPQAPTSWRQTHAYINPDCHLRGIWHAISLHQRLHRISPHKWHGSEIVQTISSRVIDMVVYSYRHLLKWLPHLQMAWRSAMDHTWIAPLRVDLGFSEIWWYRSTHPWEQSSRGPPGADRTQVCPMLATWTLLSGIETSSQIIVSL